MPNRSSPSVRVVFPRFSQEELIQTLREGVASLSRDLPLQRAVLFGSWAARRATAFSDIDLLVVYDDPARDDAFATVRKHVCIRSLEPHIYTTSEAEGVAGVLDRMVRDGVVLWGDAPGGVEGRVNGGGQGT